MLLQTVRLRVLEVHHVGGSGLNAALAGLVDALGGSPVKLQPEAQFCGWGAVLDDVGFGGIISEMVKIINNKAHKALSVFVFACTLLTIDIPIENTRMQLSNSIMDRVFMADAFGLRNGVVLQGLMILAAKSQVDGLVVQIQTG